jgi:hypothetical protein
MKIILHGSCAARTELTARELASGVSSQHGSSCDGHVLIQDICRVSRGAVLAQPVVEELHALLGVTW